MTRIEIDLEDEAARQLWIAVGHLVDVLPGEWVLVGGLMVQLHALEHGVADVRLTRDIDILGQARPQGTLAEIDRRLREDGFAPTGLDADGFAHRYERGGVVVDVLAPDGIKRTPKLADGAKAVGVPGGTQALARSEVVTVVVDSETFELRRPTLLGAILIKARSLTRHADPDSQREDLLRLLAVVEDPRVMAGELKGSERRWLRRAEERLGFGAPAVVDEATIRSARLAYRMLVRSD